jgi:hypothetical protein
MQINLDVLQSKPVVARLVRLEQATQRFSDGRERQVVLVTLHTVDGRVINDTIGVSDRSPKLRAFRSACNAVADAYGENVLLEPLRWESKYYEGSEPRFSYSVWVPVEPASEKPTDQDLQLTLELMEFGQPGEGTTIPIPQEMGESFATTDERRELMKKYGGLVGWCTRLSAIGLLDGYVDGTVFHIQSFNVSE